MTAFLVVGGIGLVVVVGSLVLGDLLEGAFDAIGLDAGSGLFSTPVIGSFLAASGFGGALVLSSTSAGAAMAALVGAGAGTVLAAAALVMTRSLIRMPTDEPVRLSDIVGKTAHVITRIPDGGFGEVSLVHLGQRMKLNARADGPVPSGSNVVVVAVNSASSVLVEPEGDFWGRQAPLQRGE